MITFRLIEPLIFRESGEIDPWVSGIYSDARTSIFPSPSTLVGTIATYFMEQGLTLSPSEEWYEEMLSVIPDKDVIFKGPFLRLGEGIYIGSKIEGKVYDLKLLINYLKDISIKLWYELSYGIQGEKSVLEDLKASFSYKDVVLEKVGIGLDRKAKTVKKSLIYNVNLIDFSKILKKLGIEANNAEFFLESKNFKEELNFISNLGGRGRIAAIRASKETIINKYLDNKKCSKYILYFVSDCLINKPLSADLRTVFGEKDIFFAWNWDFFKDIFNRKVREIKGGKIYVGVRGAGFSLRKKIRKPIYTTVFQGSLLAVEFEKEVNPFELFWNEPAQSVAWRLGYGTFIPIPVA